MVWWINVCVVALSKLSEERICMTPVARVDLSTDQNKTKSISSIAEH
jgi:hypothetical protein